MDLHSNKENETYVKVNSDELFNVVISLSKQYNLPEPSLDDYSKDQSYGLDDDKEINVKDLETIFSILSKNKKENK